MRAYFFVNSALSGIQKGLQMGHCVAEMSQAHTNHDVYEDHPDYLEWASEHKTVVLLEGGFHANLKEIEAFFEPVMYEGEWPEGFEPPGQNPYLWASFTEDEETMNGMMTCVGIILPERIYEAAKLTREKAATLSKHGFGFGGPEDEWYLAPTLEGERMIREKYDISTWSPYTGWEVELIKLLNSCPLAR